MTRHQRTQRGREEGEEEEEETGASDLFSDGFTGMRERGQDGFT